MIKEPVKDVEGSRMLNGYKVVLKFIDPTELFASPYSIRVAVYKDQKELGFNYLRYSGSELLPYFYRLKNYLTLEEVAVLAAKELIETYETNIKFNGTLEKVKNDIMNFGAIKE